jgi:hypothetical protein
MGPGGKQIRVESTNLSQLCEKLKLGLVDAIKLDVEGAEPEIFSDSVFFQKHHPRIVFEGAGEVMIDRCEKILSQYGYSLERVPQIGQVEPLILCT